MNKMSTIKIRKLYKKENHESKKSTKEFIILMLNMSKPYLLAAWQQ